MVESLSELWAIREYYALLEIALPNWMKSEKQKGIETSMDINQDEVEFDLLHLAQVLWHHVLPIILAGIILGVAVLGFTKVFVKPTYDSQVYLYVNSNNLSVGGTQVSLSDLSVAKSLVDTYIVILNTRTTLNEVIERAGVDYTYEQLKKMISAKSVNSTEIFSVNVTSTNPQEAAILANTVAEVLPYKIAEVVDGSSVRIVDYAIVAPKRSSPSYSTNTLIGVALGIFLMSAIYIIRDLMDEQIHDTDYLSKTYGEIPVLAVIPDLTAKNSNHYSYYRESRQSGKQNG